MNFVITMSKGEGYTLSAIIALQKFKMYTPSYQELANLTGYNKRNIRKQIASLCEKGLLVKHCRLINGKAYSNRYEINQDLQMVWDEICNELEIGY
jgi:biotin operon repressor